MAGRGDTMWHEGMRAMERWEVMERESREEKEEDCYSCMRSSVYHFVLSTLLALLHGCGMVHLFCYLGLGVERRGRGEMDMVLAGWLLFLELNEW